MMVDSFQHSPGIHRCYRGQPSTTSCLARSSSVLRAYFECREAQSNTSPSRSPLEQGVRLIVLFFDWNHMLHTAKRLPNALKPFISFLRSLAPMARDRSSRHCNMFCQEVLSVRYSPCRIPLSISWMHYRSWKRMRKIHWTGKLCEGGLVLRPHSYQETNWRRKSAGASGANPR